MSEKETVNLLRECDAGIKMGISAIDDVMSHVKNKDFHDKMFGYKQEYLSLQSAALTLLDKHNAGGKDPDALSKGMAWMKTTFKLGINDTDASIADIMTDGCNMGVKTLNKFLNEYRDADDDAIDIANRLVELGERQVTEMRRYL